MNIVLGPLFYSVLIAGQLQAPEPANMDNGMSPRQQVLQPEVPVVGGVEHFGWGLSGNAGRHYFFGGIGFADYNRGGQRHVVSLQEETDPALPDRNNYLYYREIGTGNRWSISKHADRGAYVLYFQPYQDPRTVTVERPRWQMFQSAQLIEDTRSRNHRSTIPEQGTAGVGRDQFAPRSNVPALGAPALGSVAPRQVGPIVAEQYVQPRFSQPQPSTQLQFVQPGQRYVYQEPSSCCGN